MSAKGTIRLDCTELVNSITGCEADEISWAQAGCTKVECRVPFSNRFRVDNRFYYDSSDRRTRAIVYENRSPKQWSGAYKIELTVGDWLAVLTTSIARTDR